jgi:PTS system N-acetylglucosamine-specific IIC component
MRALDVKLGFGFSAGLFDYVLNFGKATRPLLLLPVGAIYAVVYYGAFRWAIQRFDLKTPGREAEGQASAAIPQTASGSRGAAFLRVLGGAGNLASVDACTTRLRLVLNEPAAADETALRALGARGLVRPSAKTLQVVLGPIADQVAEEIRQARAGENAMTDANAWRAALGGQANVLDARLVDTRIVVRVRDAARADQAGLRALGARAVATPSQTSVHVILGPQAAAVFAVLA